MSGERRGRRLALWALAAAGLLALVAAPPASRLALDTDLAALLPDDSEAAAAYGRFLREFGGLQKVFVVLRAAEGSDAAAGTAELAEAAFVLAGRLESSAEVAAARAGLEDRDLEFFGRYIAERAPLLLDESELAGLGARLEPAALARRAARIRAALWRPEGSLEARLAMHDPLDLGRERLAALAGPGSIRVDPWSGGFVSPDGAAALVVVTPAGGEIDPESGRRLAADLDRAAEAAHRAVGAPFEVFAVGGPLYAARDEAILRRDLQRTLGTSGLACGLLLVAAFEGLALPLVVLGAVPLALLWTAAALELALGGLAAVAIGFAAVLVGLGIDYGIHGATRYRQELAAAPPMEALGRVYRGAGPAILTSALTTAGAFGVLGLAHFRPLRDLGAAVALGIASMVVAAAAAAATLPWLAGRPPRRPRALWRALGRGVDAVAALAGRRPAPVLGLAALLTVGALFGASRLRIDPALDVFRPAVEPLAAAERELARHFGVQVDTTAVLVPGADLGRALERAGQVERLLAVAEPRLQVRSPRRWLVAGDERDRRLARLRELPLERAADDLERELERAGLDPAAFAPGLRSLRALGRGEDPGEPPPGAWPDWLRELVRLEATGATAALHLRIPAGAWPEGPPGEVRRRVAAAAPGTAFASAAGLGRELRTLARRDAGALGVAALAVVLLVVGASYRGRLRDAGSALLPVTLGTLWTLGGWGLAGRPLDLLTIAALPVLLGIGIDDGLHVVHARAADRAAGARGALAKTGRAVALTTLTTGAGFGSLALSSLPGLRRAGLLLAAGVVLCLAATVAVLPALEALARRR